ncbi:hypothetical protein [Paractinoplanes toevensis]|nr:hypothetical protein [Actinoplanes toevensis]
MAVALVIVLAGAGSEATPAGPRDDAALLADCQRRAQEIVDKYRNVPNVSVAVACQWPDGTALDLRRIPPKPAPIPVMTVGHAGCVNGAGRPVTGTTLTSVSATATSGEAVIYERQRLDGSESVDSSGSPVLEFGPGDLAPGGSYRWRARVDDTAELAGSTAWPSRLDDDEIGWSPWCEFTVSADAVDYRGLGEVSLDALQELGLRPDRTYTISLSGHQQRLLRAGSDAVPTRARMTLTGLRWTDLLVQLTESAFIADETAAEAGEDDPPSSDGTAYRTLVDVISVKLGGPRHPQLS